ncbi:hypothetical protein BDY21DRAFT_334689, partial [Lineolata rhizophorae]
RLLKRKEPLRVSNGHQMLDDEALDAQLQREIAEDAAIVMGGAKKRRRCKKCGTLGHNSRTCQTNTAGTEDQSEPQNA